VAAPTLFGFGAQQVVQTAATCPLPANTQADDILLLVAETDNQAVTIASPAGYVEIPNSPQTSSTGSNTTKTRLTVFWKRHSGSEASVVTNDPGDHITVGVIVVRGCITTGNPWDVIAADIKTPSSTAVSAPGLTTTVDDCLIFAICARGLDNQNAQFVNGWTNASLSGVSNHSEYRGSQGNGGGFGMASGTKALAGLVSPTTTTMANASENAYITIAFKPPSPPPSGNPRFGDSFAISASCF
jgi:hypothetical protein